MFSRMNNKREVETFLFAKAGPAYFNTGSPDTDITNPSTGAFVLADGQLGTFDATGYGSRNINNSLNVADTYAVSPVINIYAGLPRDPVTGRGLSRPYPLWAREYEKSGNINGGNWVLATYQAYTPSQSSVWIVGNPAAATSGKINILDNTEYVMHIAESSTMNDILYNPNGANIVSGSFVTPNYTALTAITSPVDHLVQNIAYDINRNSKVLNITNRNVYRGTNNVVAFAIGTSAATGVTISSITAGTVVPVVTGVPVGGSIVFTQDMVTSLTNALGTPAADWDTTAKIVPINLATAGNAASAAAGAQGIIIIATDRQLYYSDRAINVKPSLEVSLPRGFSFPTVFNKRCNFPLEGSGLPRQLDIMYRNTHGQRLYNLESTVENASVDPIVAFPSPVDMAVNYDMLVITHANIDQINLASVAESPLKTIVCAPAGNAQMTALQSHLNTWLLSTGNVAIETTN